MQGRSYWSIYPLHNEHFKARRRGGYTRPAVNNRLSYHSFINDDPWMMIDKDEAWMGSGTYHTHPLFPGLRRSVCLVAFGRCRLSGAAINSNNNNVDVINSTFEKIFNTRNAWKCLVVSSRTIAIRKRKFLNKFSVTDNALCEYSLPLLRLNLNHVARTFS